MKYLTHTLAIALLAAYAHAQSTSQTNVATTTSVYHATKYQPGYASATPSNQVDSAGGGSGADTGSFSLSSGGLIAIIVVVVVVAVFGIGSIVLFILAKRRQWNVRATLRRASRRLTGRDPGPTSKELEARKKRSGMVASGKRDRGMKLEDVRGQKKGVGFEVRRGDVEKGTVGNATPPRTKEPRKSGWIGKLWGNDYK